MTSIEILILFLVMGVATFLTRVLPFVVLGQISNHRLLDRLSRILPPMIMTVLVFFGLTELNYQTDLHFLLTLGAVIGTIVLQLFFKNPLLSIVLGTTLYKVGLYYL